MQRKRLKEFCQLMCYNFMTIERRINLYLDHKLFEDLPLHTLPQWVGNSQIIDPDVKSLLNPMISPRSEFPLCYRVFGTESRVFDFEKMSKSYCHQLTASGFTQAPSSFWQRSTRASTQRTGMSTARSPTLSLAATAQKPSKMKRATSEVKGASSSACCLIAESTNLQAKREIQKKKETLFT